MGSFMVYEALCAFASVKPDESIVNLINPGVLSVHQNNLKDTLNEIYDFKQDTIAIKNIENFEYYRRNYPIRYEWHHYDSQITLPIVNN
jgi:erythronate-4-phosphate dehydrogenase